MVRMPTSRAPSRLTAVARSALPYSVQPEEQPQRDDEGDGDGIDREALAGEAQRADGERGVRERRAALALGAEEQQAQSLHREVRSRPRRSAAPARRCAPAAGRRGDRETARSRRRSPATAATATGTARGGSPPEGQASTMARQHDIDREGARDPAASAARAAPRRDRRRTPRRPSPPRAWPCPASGRTSARHRSARHR